ncbi:hypothetical protein ACFSL6_02300 [Paenibacillus thailandensis]|uniref:Lipoprotein SmpA/OmlA domain-containing protein n=1 Tax=Paenibacillus thailandensis TaxID=393250 RepID=A0ABW5QWH6_9BACL
MMPRMLAWIGCMLKGMCALFAVLVVAAGCIGTSVAETEPAHRDPNLTPEKAKELKKIYGLEESNRNNEDRIRYDWGYSIH